MPTLCRAHGILFLMTPLTACSAVGKALREQLHGEWFPPQSMFDDSGRKVLCNKHADLQELLAARVLGATEAAALFKFATVRNPFDCAVSGYVKRRGRFQRRLEKPHSRQAQNARLREEILFCRDHDFDAWIAWRHVKRDKQGRQVRVKQRDRMLRRIAGMDFVMRYENLDADFAEAMRRAGVTEEVRVPVFHQTPGKRPDYRSYYSETSRRIVQEAYAPVLEALEYTF